MTRFAAGAAVALGDLVGVGKVVGVADGVTVCGAVVADGLPDANGVGMLRDGEGGPAVGTPDAPAPVVGGGIETGATVAQPLATASSASSATDRAKPSANSRIICL